jgi:hypothetical protein
MSKFIDRAIAEKLVGREHGSGKLVRHEQRAGRVVMISQCSNCRAERPVSLTNAAQAVQNPTIAVIACPMVCKRVAQPPAATEVQKSEKEMTADEYRKQVVEPEFEARKLNAQRVTNAPIQAANARAAVAANGALWEQRERFLLAVAYSVGAVSSTTPESYGTNRSLLSKTGRRCRLKTANGRTNSSIFILRITGCRSWSVR